MTKQIRLYGLALSVALMLLSVIGLSTQGVKLGLAFSGGHQYQIATSTQLNQASLATALGPLFESKVTLEAQDDAYHWAVTSQSAPAEDWLNEVGQVTGSEISLLGSSEVGAQVGDELKNQGSMALLVAMLAILSYLAIRFEWRLAVGAVGALFHDVLIVLGVFAWSGLSFDLTVLAALLAILGYSLNDSIVVGDRFREIITQDPRLAISQAINLAISSSLSRTLITSGTTLATIASVWLLAGKPLQGFAVAMFVGVTAGTLSSIFVSSTVPELIGVNAQSYIKQEEPEYRLG